MFGYVKPYKPELRIRDYDHFRSIYCGLCHTLSVRYSPLWRLTLSYDICFLAEIYLACNRDNNCIYCAKRCPVSPLKKHRILSQCTSLETAADISVILFHFKLSDDIVDEKGWKRFISRILLHFSNHGWNKARKRLPLFSEFNEKLLAQLKKSESHYQSADKTADCFASILKAAASAVSDNALRRTAGELLYQIGRWIYYIDALDDLKDDLTAGSFNILAKRFDISCFSDIDANKSEIQKMLEDAAAGAALAAELLPISEERPIIENTIYNGLPAVFQAVFSGSYQKDKLIRLHFTDQ